MSESRLYSFSPETKEKLRKFRLGTSRAKDPQAIIYIIDNKTQEIRPEDGEVYSKMEDVADELPESSPRFILLSYPLTLRMMYAGAVELMRNTAEVNRVIEVYEEDDIISIESKLQSAD
ncbi:GMF family protein [Aspergillus tubingensis]|uniref:GMF family protein n=1 Tax=Aspergillus tubingensis TaxID=5068 RepID=UPI001577FAA2|nr:glial factor naturation factor [Aspergillus tubingensis]GFN15390.1 glial factor naturation factor [Aspergillus tubingensis]